MGSLTREVAAMLQELVQQVPLAIAQVGRQLSADFPMDVFDAISEGQPNRKEPTTVAAPNAPSAKLRA